MDLHQITALADEALGLAGKASEMTLGEVEDEGRWSGWRDTLSIHGEDIRDVDEDDRHFIARARTLLPQLAAAVKAMAPVVEAASDVDTLACPAHLDALERALSDFNGALRRGLCEHEWTDMRNAVVVSGEICLKCNSVRPGNAAMEATMERKDG